MEFYTTADRPRPVRLNETIRAWAWASEHGRYGDEAMGHMAVEMGDIPGYREMPPLRQQDLALRRIAERAPIRLCPEERVSGAATLGLAIRHCIPATLDGKEFLGSVSHHTTNYRRVLTEGLDGYAASVEERLRDPALTEQQREFLGSLQGLIESMRVWHARYLEATKAAGMESCELLRQVPFSPARTFREAVQSLWFTFAFMRLCGNWPGIGRIDWLIGDYLKKDLAAGRITLDEAREMLASFFIKGCEWIQSDTPQGSGDAQHYQNIVLGGTDENGCEIANEVTGLVLDIVEELAISDFPITVRVSERTPEWLLRRVSEVMQHGGGIVAVYNEDVVLEALKKAGYNESEIWKFANDGCWEVQLPGETCFAYMPFDALQLFDDVIGLNEEGDAPEYRSIEEIYAAFSERLRAHVRVQYEMSIGSTYEKTEDGWRSKWDTPCSVVSLFTDGCVERARSYYDLGPNYTVRSPHIGGAPDVANSLYAIEKIVFEEKKMALNELIQALRANWEGYELQRLYVHNRYTYYGNDDDGADRWMTRILNDFADMVRDCQGEEPVLYAPGVSTFGRQINWLPERRATAFGAKKGEILSGNGSPTPGTDTAGATAIIRSYCKADMTWQTTGAALDIKLYPGTVKGENGVEAIGALIRGFVALGGYFMQIDVMDAQVLRAAQENPKAFKTLSVRVSGWNARFVTLDREWQNMIIERTAQHV